MMRLPLLKLLLIFVLQAAYKGLPYQTFIASVLHEYAAGHFDAN
jgi:predicted DNA binding CopG/RHH family protein